MFHIYIKQSCRESSAFDELIKNTTSRGVFKSVQRGEHMVENGGAIVYGSREGGGGERGWLI